MKVSPGGSHRGANWERAGSELGASWSEGSEPNVILGFRVPTTIGLRKSPAHSPCSQLAPLAPRPFLGPWNLPGASGSPQLTPLLPDCSPCSQLAPLAPRASLGPWSKLGVSWSEPNVILGFRVPTNIGLRKPPAHSPCSQLAPRPSLGPWNLPGASGSPQLTPLLPDCSPCSQLAPLAPRASLGPWSKLGVS